jgi:uncharacterized protein (TIGR03437 family)
MFSSFPGQLNVQVPLELAGSTSAQVVVTVAGQASAPVTVSIGSFSPGIFVINNGYGAVQIANTSLFAAPSGSIPGAQSRGANPGEFITIYSTGLGAVANPPATGAPGSGNPTVTVPQVTVGGVPATVSFSGLVGGLVGLYQVNVQIPAGAPAGGFVNLVMSIGGVQSNVVPIAVGGSGESTGSVCQGFALEGTATALTGTVPANCLFQPGSTVTGGVPVSLTARVSGNQTIYSGNVSGNGTGQCATGSTGNWTATFSLTIVINTNIASLPANGGILLGNQRITSGSIDFCGSTQLLSFITASNLVTGNVAPGGAATVYIGGPIGYPPIVMRGNANNQTLNGPLAGAIVTALLTNNFSGLGTLSIPATGTSSGGQTVYTATGAGGGNVQQCPGGSGTWTATLSAFTATVSPAVPSLVTNGGTVSGTWSISLSGTVCGSNGSNAVHGTVAGSVLPGGQTLMVLTITGEGEPDEPVVLTGTATSLTGTLTGPQLLDDPTATGSIPLSATGASSGSQTVYTGGGSGSGTTTCPGGSTGNWTASVSATITVSPAVPSLATSGGSLSGTASYGFSATICGSNISDQDSGTVTGSVAPGGAVTLNLD